jgi:hypothetical protein
VDQISSHSPPEPKRRVLLSNLTHVWVLSTVCSSDGQHKHLIVRRRPSPLRCSQLFPQFSDTIGKYRTVYQDSLVSWWSFEDHKIFFEAIPRLSIDNSFFVNPQIVRSHTLLVHLDRHIFCGQNWVLVVTQSPASINC